MKNGIISVRLDSAYQIMVAELKMPEETDTQFLKRAIDALALTDDNFAKILATEDVLEESDKEYLDQYEKAGHKRVSTLIFEAPTEDEEV